MKVIEKWLIKNLITDEIIKDNLTYKEVDEEYRKVQQELKGTIAPNQIVMDCKIMFIKKGK